MDQTSFSSTFMKKQTNSYLNYLFIIPFSDSCTIFWSSWFNHFLMSSFLSTLFFPQSFVDISFLKHLLRIDLLFPGTIKSLIWQNSVGPVGLCRFSLPRLLIPIQLSNTLLLEFMFCAVSRVYLQISEKLVHFRFFSSSIDVFIWIIVISSSSCDVCSAIVGPKI